jgi:hypothetical protein
MTVFYIEVDLIQVFRLREISHAETLATCTSSPFRHSGWRDCDHDVLSRGAESQTYLKHQRRLLQKKVCITSAPQPPQISSIGSLHARHMQSTASLPSAWSTYVLQYVSGVFRRCWHDAVVRTDRVCTHEYIKCGSRPICIMLRCLLSHTTLTLKSTNSTLNSTTPGAVQTRLWSRKTRAPISV